MLLKAVNIKSQQKLLLDYLDTLLIVPFLKQLNLLYVLVVEMITNT